MCCREWVLWYESQLCLQSGVAGALEAGVLVVRNPPLSGRALHSTGQNRPSPKVTRPAPGTVCTQ